MASSMWSAACVVFLMTVSSKCTYSATDVHEYNDVNKVLKSIEKLLVYYRQNIQNLNLDGFFGIRVIEGHMLVMLKEHKSGQHEKIPDSVWQNIARLAKIATTVSEDGLEFVRKDNPKYFDDFSPLIKYPWTFFKHQRRLDPDLRWEIPQYKAKNKAPLSEKLSDKCMKEVMNSSSSSAVCHLSELCLTTMTNRGLTGYGITHQLIWSMLAEMSTHCKTSANAALKEHGMESLNSMQLEMCTNNFYEMIAVVHVLMKGNVHESHQDLFLEQQFVCPSLGFHEFIKKDYLDQILSWQYSSGCFGDKEEEEEEDYDDEGDAEVIDLKSLLKTYHKKSDIKNQDNSRGNVQQGQQQRHANFKSKIDEDVGNHVAKRLKRNEIYPETIKDEKQETWIDDSYQGRKLLVEKRLTGDCLSHKSGVAAGALVMYLRYLILPGDIKWNGPHALFEKDRQKMIPSNNEQRRDYLDDARNDDNNDENNSYDESIERGKENKETYYYDYQEDKAEVRGNKVDNANENILIQSDLLIDGPTESALIQKQKIRNDEFVKKINHIRRKDDYDNTYSNDLYNSIQEEKLKTSHPSAFLIILVSLSPMLMVFFFVFKVFRRYRPLIRCFKV